MKKISFFILGALLMAGAFSGCYYDNYGELHPNQALNSCDTTHVISFASDIVPILNNSCGTGNDCHGTTNTSGYDFTNYAGVNQSVIDAVLYSSVSWDGTVNPMPKNSTAQISVCDITKIRMWIDAGAPNN